MSLDDDRTSVVVRRETWKRRPLTGSGTKASGVITFAVSGINLCRPGAQHRFSRNRPCTDRDRQKIGDVGHEVVSALQAKPRTEEVILTGSTPNSCTITVKIEGFETNTVKNHTHDLVSILQVHGYDLQVVDSNKKVVR